MRDKDLIESLFDVVSCAITRRKLLANWGQYAGCLVPHFLFREPQDIREIALDGGLDGFIALDTMQVPDAEAHQQGCGQDNRQFQRQKEACAVADAPLPCCVRLHRGIPSIHSTDNAKRKPFLDYRKYKRLELECVKWRQTIVKSCELKDALTQPAAKIGVRSTALVCSGIQVCRETSIPKAKRKPNL